MFEKKDKMKKITLSQAVPFVTLMVLSVIALFVPSVSEFVGEGKYNSADIAWIIVATALVFLMTPGLAFFYGGMVHRKNVLSTMIKSFVATGVVSVLWVTIGFSLCFGDPIGGFIGNPFTYMLFNLLNRNSRLINGQHTRRLTRRGAYSAGKLGEIICRGKYIVSLLPVLAINSIIKFWNYIT